MSAAGSERGHVDQSKRAILAIRQNFLGLATWAPTENGSSLLKSKLYMVMFPDTIDEKVEIVLCSSGVTKTNELDIESTEDN